MPRRLRRSMSSWWVGVRAGWKRLVSPRAGPPRHPPGEGRPPRWHGPLLVAHHTHERELVRYLSAAIGELGVEVRLGVTADTGRPPRAGTRRGRGRTGARRTRPDVPGAFQPHVLSGDDLRGLLTGDDPAAAKRLAWHQRSPSAPGGASASPTTWPRCGAVRSAGCRSGETWSWWAAAWSASSWPSSWPSGADAVTVLEEGEKLGMEMAHPRRARALHEARRHDVRFVTGAELLEIRARRHGLPRRRSPTRSRQPTRSSWPRRRARRRPGPHARGGRLTVEVVGDAARVGCIEAAVRGGYLHGRGIVTVEVRRSTGMIVARPGGVHRRSVSERRR